MVAVAAVLASPYPDLVKNSHHSGIQRHRGGGFPRHLGGGFPIQRGSGLPGRRSSGFTRHSVGHLSGSRRAPSHNSHAFVHPGQGVHGVVPVHAIHQQGFGGKKAVHH